MYPNVLTTKHMEGPGQLGENNQHKKKQHANN
jgi:hypothetical protein